MSRTTEEIINQIKALRYDQPVLDDIIPLIIDNIDFIQDKYLESVRKSILAYKKGYNLSLNQNKCLWASYNELVKKGLLVE